MLENVINNPEIGRYIHKYEANQNIFLEGDDPDYLYILLSGELDVLKGEQKISEIAGRGSIFGEMSFLLGAKRTATVRAVSEVKAIKVPKDEIQEFLQKFPELCQETSKLLAQRLNQASQVLYGLKETCDHIPDAVIITDKDGNIISWNNAAKSLYGRDWKVMSTRLVEEVFEDPQEYRDLVKRVREKYSSRENILRIKHPQRGSRYVSTSMNVLYDAQHNYQGILSIGRDVTSAETLKRKIRRAWYWLIPSFVILLLLAGATFYGYPYFIKGYQVIDVPKRELRNQMAKDFLLLKSLLVNDLESGRLSRTKSRLQDFRKVQVPGDSPYLGLLLLDKDKKVIDALSLVEKADADRLIGRSYAHINFQSAGDSIHYVLTLYRKEKDQPGSRKGVEVAFELKKSGHLLGWLILQMNMDSLKGIYGLDEEGLKKMHFTEPEG